MLVINTSLQYSKYGPNSNPYNGHYLVSKSDLYIRNLSEIIVEI